MSNDVVSEIAAWTARAAVARTAAVELKDLSVSLKTVAASNYFGTGCQEGAELFEALNDLISSGVKALVSSAAASTQLASAALACEQALANSDADSAMRIQK